MKIMPKSSRVIYYTGEGGVSFTSFIQVLALEHGFHKDKVTIGGSFHNDPLPSVEDVSESIKVLMSFED